MCVGEGGWKEGACVCKLYQDAEDKQCLTAREKWAAGGKKVLRNSVT